MSLCCLINYPDKDVDWFNHVNYPDNLWGNKETHNTSSCNNYRPRSEGDNVLGSVRLSVCPSVDIRGSALPSAAKSKEEWLSVRRVCLCVELSRGCGRSAFNYWQSSCLFLFKQFLQWDPKVSKQEILPEQTQNWEGWEVEPVFQPGMPWLLLS